MSSSDSKYLFAQKGFGWVTYIGRVGSDLRELLSVPSRRIEPEYLAEGAAVVDLTSTTDVDALVKWSVYGPRVNPLLTKPDRFDPGKGEIDDMLLTVVEENYGLPVKNPDYHGLDELPVDRYVAALKTAVPGVRIGVCKDGEVVWIYPPPEPVQQNLFTYKVNKTNRQAEGGVKKEER